MMKRLPPRRDVYDPVVPLRYELGLPLLGWLSISIFVVPVIVVVVLVRLLRRVAPVQAQTEVPRSSVGATPGFRSPFFFFVVHFYPFFRRNEIVFPARLQLSFSFPFCFGCQRQPPPLPALRVGTQAPPGFRKRGVPPARADFASQEINRRGDFGAQHPQRRRRGFLPGAHGAMHALRAFHGARFPREPHEPAVFGLGELQDIPRVAPYSGVRIRPARKRVGAPVRDAVVHQGWQVWKVEHSFQHRQRFAEHGFGGVRFFVCQIKKPLAVRRRDVANQHVWFSIRPQVQEPEPLVRALQEPAVFRPKRRLETHHYFVLRAHADARYGFFFFQAQLGGERNRAHLSSALQNTQRNRHHHEVALNFTRRSRGRAARAGDVRVGAVPNKTLAVSVNRVAAVRVGLNLRHHRVEFD
mmetsp:Transcript_4381/g.16218  ORF Transcript_4381/g.16218 Transcript_4381/m.16218 type:complete len:412 (-) Transcript_4381:1788-3023(-)